MSPKLKAQLQKIGKLWAFFLVCLYVPAFLLGTFSYTSRSVAPRSELQTPRSVQQAFAGAEQRSVFRLEVFDSRARATPNQIERDLLQACLKSDGTAKSIELNEGKVAVDGARARDFIVCAMTTYERRLCDAGERQRLASNLARLIALSRERGFSSIYSVLESSLTGSRLAEGGEIASGDRSSRHLHQDIATSVWKLSEQGYLSAQDFGRGANSVPTEIMPYLRQPTSRRCA